MKNRKSLDKTTLLCCALGIAISTASLSRIKELEKAEQEMKNLYNSLVQIQSTSVVETVSIAELNDIKAKLTKNFEIKSPYFLNESEDSFNAIYEEEIANQQESEDEYNSKVESEISVQLEGNEDSYNEEVGNEIETELEMIEEENSPVFKFSQKDFELLCEITYAEAGNQTLEQQIAAAATILNRVQSDQFPNSIQEVIHQRGQFASTKDGHIYACGKTVDFFKVPDMTREAARRALNGEDPTENWLRKEAKRLGLNSEKYASDGALYFYSPEFTSSSELAARSNIKCKVQKGGHIFYKVWG